MAQQSKQLYEFGPYRVDSEKRLLLREGQSVPLPSKAFDTLLVLVEHRSEIVSKEHLMKALWPDTFVEESNLSQNIFLLRKALGETAQDHHIIVTIPGKGYRLAERVREVAANELDLILETHSTSRVAVEAASVPRASNRGIFQGSGPFQHYRKLFLSIALGSLLVTIAGGMWLFHARKPPMTEPNPALRSDFAILSGRTYGDLTILPLSTRPGWARHPSFSPDGSAIVFDYVAEGSDHPDIYVQVLGDEKMLRLTASPGVSVCPSWSPDGETVAYTLYGSGASERTIMSVTPLGGTNHRVRRLSAEDGPCRLSWSPDGKLLAYADKPPAEPPGVFLTSADGSDIRRLTVAPDKMLDASPAFSPDGRSIAFRRISSMSTGEIYVVPSSGGRATRLTFLNEDLDHPIWSSDGKTILFTVRGPASGGGALYSVASHGGKAQQLLIPDSSISTPAISSRGDKLAYEKAVFSMAIWKASITDASAPPTKFIASTRTDNDPSFSPDGTKIAFDSTRDGTEAMWLCDADGLNPAKLAVVHQGGTPSWAPDGARIAFDDRRSGRSHIYLINVPDGTPQQITAGDFDDEVPTWSADGKWIYFASNRTGAYEIWKISTTTRSWDRVTHNGGLFASESPDGRFVYYNKPAIPYIDQEARGLWRTPVAGGPEEIAIRDLGRLWQVKPEGIYFVDNTLKAEPMLKMFALQKRTTKVVAHLVTEATDKGGHNLAISPDGHSALYVRVESWNSELMLVKGRSW